MKVAIIIYSNYGHITTLAQAIQKGIKSAGGKSDLYQVPETLSGDVLNKMGAQTFDIPIATPDILTKYDAFLFGVPTRFGTLPAQWSAFWDATGTLWANGELFGKIAGLFVSTGTYGGGQESTVKNCLSYLAHHGIIYVPLGYKNAFADLANVEEVHGGSPWGAGVIAGPDGSKDPSDLELNIGRAQGKEFYLQANQLLNVAKTGNNQQTTGAAAATATTNKEATKKRTNVDNRAKTADNGRSSAPAATTDKASKESGGNCCIVM